MEQPIRDEIQEIKRRLIEVERYISPIKFTQLEIDSGRLFRKIDEIQKNTNITKIQTEGVSGDLLQLRESQVDLRDRLIAHTEDLKAIKDKQDAHAGLLEQLIGIGEDHTKTLETVATKEDLGKLGTRIDHIENTMATKEDLGKLETRIDHIENIMATKEDLSKLETRIDHIENTMATKDGIAALRSEFSAFKTTQEQLLQAILDRLPPKQ